jgi:hypothetical protein
MNLRRSIVPAAGIALLCSNTSAAENCATSMIAYRLPECAEFFRRGGVSKPAIDSSPQTAAKPQTSPWKFQVETDRITGAKTTAIWQSNRNGTISPHRRVASRNVETTMLLICRGGNKREIVIRFGDQLVASHRQAITYRIDNRQPVTSTRWDAATDSAAVGLWSSSQVDAFFRSISNGAKLLFRIEHDVFGTAETEFDLTGVNTASEPLRLACNWPVGTKPAS